MSSKQFICEICGTSYSRAEFLRRHARSAHQKEAGKTFHCTHCNKSFARSDVLNRHRRRCHPDGNATTPSKSSSTSRTRGSSSDASASSPSDSEYVHKLPPKPTTSYQPSNTFPDLSNLNGTQNFSIFDNIGSLLGNDDSQVTSIPTDFDYPSIGPDLNYTADIYSETPTDNALSLNFNQQAPVDINAVQPYNFDVLGPEKTIRRIEYDTVSQGFGLPLNPSHNEISDRFYLPAERFAGPYSIAHWNLPPLHQLSKLCSNALQTTNVHLPLIHMPSFKLSETSVCVAFALCSTGGNTPKTLKAKNQSIDHLSDAELNNKPGKSAAEQTGIVKEVVRHEKIAMIHGSLSNRSSKTAQSDLIGLVMALLIYYAPVILEEDSSSNIWNGINGGFAFICEAARNAGMLHPNSAWVNPNKPKLSYMGERSKASIYLAWKSWINDEQKRRAIFIIYLTDLVNSIATNKKPTLRIDEIDHVPLPANDKLWMAPNAQSWAKLIDTTPRTPTHGEIMAVLFNQGDDNYFGQALGPFARNVIICSIVRGLLEIGEENGGSLGSKYMNGYSEGSAIYAFRTSLINWRKGYDFDLLCQKQKTYVDQVSQQQQQQQQQQYQHQSNSVIYSNQSSSSRNYSDSNNNSFDFSGSTTPSGSPPTSYEPSPTKDFLDYGTTTTPKDSKPPYVSEPLPFFWLAQLLLNILSPETSLFFNFVTPPQQQYSANVPRPGRRGFSDKIKGMDLRGMLTASRTFARMQEGLSGLSEQYW
ncbi:hypothetical protein E3Q23_03824 [Wallemia mellicola]|uniref:C2H2-type domain-containing protein n=1 Tax=Wallemia mellicola TaxID=1708541 RepID=A0A4T0PD01_9BASI|nr:hypothetical protein E3Q23_03824 [Wallemia mellicola]TIB96484.1 hypothetical protein E3Q17_03836 [Wallemia mellicola]TIC08034.1 hypothetical protein E3Q15_04073 [Wallemia mellicola]TIC08450.1 hypothetical protein E3Q14_03946 [Wallemia mellicola]TIC23860.1 hypothetical protein E3Q11_03761 [Wallemia mellicola]